MNNTVIQVESLFKEYRLGVISHGTLSRDLQSWWAKVRGKDDPNSKINISGDFNKLNGKFYALQDVSFKVNLGEVIGIIGHNGAGKSTLLKIISRVTAPTKGQIKIKGRLSSLLEVGTGFHPELTGRENIFLNGAIMGMNKSEIKKKFDEIVTFAEVEKFIDTPVKRYSSGMYVRLAFAVAAHLEPEILIVDEVLAVGDSQFQKKCLGKMQEVGKEGRTVLFVSHNMGAIEALCPRCICLAKGVLISDGGTKDVVFKYLAFEQTQRLIDLEKRIDRVGTGDAKVVKVILKDRNGMETDNIRMGEQFSIDVFYKGIITGGHVAVMITNLMGDRLIEANSFYSYPNRIDLKSGKITCFFEKNYLLSGEYSVSVLLGRFDENVDWINYCINFTIEPVDVYNTGRIHDPGCGIVFTEHKWNFY